MYEEESKEKMHQEESKSFDAKEAASEFSGGSSTNNEAFMKNSLRKDKVMQKKFKYLKMTDNERSHKHVKNLYPNDLNVGASNLNQVNEV